jgi:hypothetical protein
VIIGKDKIRRSAVCRLQPVGKVCNPTYFLPFQVKKIELNFSLIVFQASGTYFFLVDFT